MSRVSDFVDLYWDAAKEMEFKFAVPALVAMAQSALETGWGDISPGNMMFGMKAGKSWTGKKQLITTTEYHKSRDVKYPEVISITKQGELYKYRVKDYFRAYATPYDSFVDYAKMIKNNKRYKAAFETNDPYQFALEIARGGYATQPQYYDRVATIMRMIENAIADKKKQHNRF